jgi:hypothetical protein
LSGNIARVMHVKIYWTRFGEVQWKLDEIAESHPNSLVPLSPFVASLP